MRKINDIQDITDNIVAVKGKMHKNIHKKRHYFNMNAERQCNIFIGHGHKQTNNLKSTNDIINMSKNTASSRYSDLTDRSSNISTENTESRGSTYDESTISSKSYGPTESNITTKPSEHSSYEHMIHTKQTDKEKNNYINGIKKGLMKFYMERGIHDNEKITKPIRIKLDKTETSASESDEDSYTPVKNDRVIANPETHHKKTYSPPHFIKNYDFVNHKDNTGHNNLTKNPHNSMDDKKHDTHHREIPSVDKKNLEKHQTIHNYDACGKKCDPICEKYVSAKLSNATTVCTDSSNITSSISKHGKYVYMVYNKKCIDASGNSNRRNIRK